MYPRFLLASVCLATTVGAQSIEDPGPHPVGWRDFTFSHPVAVSDPASARLFYPALAAGFGATADPSQGPYPQVAVIHGAGTFPFDYDNICTHVASWGFVVTAIGTIADFTATVPGDARAAMYWVQDQSLKPGGFLEDMTSPAEPWSAVGHSSGAVAAFALSALESRVGTLAVLEPSYLTSMAVEDFDGELLVFGATDDTVTPPATHALPYLAAATSAPRKLYLEVQGGGHNGVLDIPFGPAPPLSHFEQHRMHRRGVTGFLRAEIFGERALYQDVLGAGIAAEPLLPESLSSDPVHWVAESSTQPGKLAWGIARERNDVAIWMASPGTASLPTDYGEFGLDPFTLTVVLTTVLDSSGIHELTANVSPGLSGHTFYFQGIAVGLEGGALTDTLSYTFP